MKIGSDLEQRIATVAARAGVAAEVAAAGDKDAKLAVIGAALGGLVGSTHDEKLSHAESVLAAHKADEHDEQLEHAPAAVLASGEALHEALNGTIDKPKRKPAHKAKRAKGRK